jgi:DinB superfamily
MSVEVYVEATGKRAFAGAMGWPGWCRAGRDEGAALQTLFDYGARYAHVLNGSGVRFTAPARASTLAVAERLKGDATTDFGAPSIAPKGDAAPIDRRWLTRNARILEACWAAFDRAVEVAHGPLAKGPRGGGRELDAIVDHVVGAEGSYLRMIAGKPPAYREGAAARGAASIAARDEERAAVLEALERALADGIPEKGPRGGARWTARYFVRRSAWHVLDHAWEIEDRSRA